MGHRAALAGLLGSDSGERILAWQAAPALAQTPPLPHQAGLGMVFMQGLQLCFEN